MFKELIEKGDIVNVLFERIETISRAEVLYTPQNTNDWFRLKKHDGEIVYVQLFSRMDLVKKGAKMSNERKGRLLEEFAIMESIRIDDLNKNGYGATNKFHNARKMHEEIIQLIIQQKPEIDEKYIKEKFDEVSNELGAVFPFIERLLRQIISDVKGRSVEVDMNFLIKWQKKISKGSGGGHISLISMKKMLEAIGIKFTSGGKGEKKSEVAEWISGDKYW